MLVTTQSAVKALLQADASISPEERRRILTAIRNRGREDRATRAVESCIIRRREAARRLNCSIRAVDHWARMGILKKVIFPGRKRAVGFRETDITALIENNQ